MNLTFNYTDLFLIDFMYAVYFFLLLYNIYQDTVPYQGSDRNPRTLHQWYLYKSKFYMSKNQTKTRYFDNICYTETCVDLF